MQPAILTDLRCMYKRFVPALPKSKSKVLTELLLQQFLLWEDVLTCEVLMAFSFGALVRSGTDVEWLVLDHERHSSSPQRYLMALHHFTKCNSSVLQSNFREHYIAKAGQLNKLNFQLKDIITVWLHSNAHVTSFFDTCGQKKKGGGFHMLLTNLICQTTTIYRP